MSGVMTFENSNMTKVDRLNDEENEFKDEKDSVRDRRATITEFNDNMVMNGETWQYRDEPVPWVNTEIQMERQIERQLATNRTPFFVTRPVNNSEILAGLGGSVRKFVVAMAKPIMKALSRNDNARVFKNFVKNILPQTGFQSHNRGSLIEQNVEQGNYQQAIDVFNEHQVQIDQDHLFPMPWCDRRDSDYATCVKVAPCRLIIPSIDKLLTERLGTQSTVITSLMQSLYDDVKNHVRTELDDAEGQLKNLGEEADMLGNELTELMVEHFWERLVIFLMCGGTLAICIIAIWTIRKAQLVQQEYYSGMMNNIVEISEQASRIGRGYRFKRRDPLDEATFRFPGTERIHPSSYRETEKKSIVRLG